MDEFPTFFEVGAREKSLSRAVARLLSDRRESEGRARLTFSTMFFEIAQVAASAALVGLRCAAALSNGRTVALQPESEPGADERASKSEDPALATSEIDKTTGNYLDDVHAETEPSCRSPALVAAPTGVGTAGDIVPLLIDRVPGCRLGFGHAELSEIVWMRDAPSFFTAGMGADNYATSMKAVTNRVVDSWLSRPDVQALMSGPNRVIGVGCALDIGVEDKAIVYALVA